MASEMDRLEELARTIKIKRVLDAARVEASKARTALPSLDERVERIEEAEAEREASQAHGKRRPVAPPSSVVLTFKPKAPPKGLTLAQLDDQLAEGVISLEEYTLKAGTIPRTSAALGLAAHSGDLAAVLAARRAGVEVPKHAPDAPTRAPKGTKTTPEKRPPTVKVDRPEKAPKDSNSADVLDMHHAIGKAWAPGMESAKLDTIPAAMKRAAMLGEAWNVGVDMRPEGVRERLNPIDKDPILAEGETWAAWRTESERATLDPEIGKFGERYLRAKLAQFILDGKIHHAVVSVFVEGEPRELIMVPKLAPVVQVAANGIERPTAMRHGWEGAGGMAKDDASDHYRAIVTIPTVSGQDGDALKLERQFPTEAQARAFVLTLIGEGGASEGEIHALGRRQISACLDDPRFTADPGIAMTDRNAVVRGIPGAADEVIDVPRKVPGPVLARQGISIKCSNQRVALTGTTAKGRTRYARRHAWQKG